LSRGFECVAVVGLGLLGGSVALAARSRGMAARVVGATRRQEARQRALDAGAVDAILPLEEVAVGADLVVLATPVYAMSEMLRRLAPGLRDAAIVTDVGSVKSPLVETLPGLLPPGVRYVGSHPMAGSHERGIDHARSDLFERTTCVVTDSPDADALERVCAFWRGLGANVVQRDAALHDAEVAWMSHVPHVLAFAFARALAAAPKSARDVSGAGFRDFTRIARSDAELWGDILTANRKALAAPLQQLGAALSDLARVVESGDSDALEHLLAEARETLSRTSPLRVPEHGKCAHHGTSSPSRGGNRTGDRSTDHE
jgi:prephenate dehydrogenase